MRIPSELYFSCWSLIAIAFLLLGFEALDRDKLTNVPPFLSYIFKLFLAVSVCHSSSQALMYRYFETKLPSLFLSAHWLMAPVLTYFMFKETTPWITSTAGTATLYLVFRSHEYGPSFILGALTDHFVRTMMLSAVGCDFLFPALVFIVSLSTLSMTAAQFREQAYLWLARSSESSTLEKIRTYMGEGKLKTVKFAAALFGSILFQEYVKLDAFNHVLALVCFACAWLGCLALLMSFQDDLGIFEFLLVNMIVGCTGNQFGLQGPTWFAFGVSVLLFRLREILGNIRLIPRPEHVALDQGEVLIEDISDRFDATGNYNPNLDQITIIRG